MKQLHARRGDTEEQKQEMHNRILFASFCHHEVAGYAGN